VLDEKTLHVAVRVRQFRIAVRQKNDPQHDPQNQQRERLYGIQKSQASSPGGVSQKIATPRIVTEKYFADCGRGAGKESVTILEGDQAK
jgi:hypothetical protein